MQDENSLCRKGRVHVRLGGSIGGGKGKKQKSCHCSFQIKNFQLKNNGKNEGKKSFIKRKDGRFELWKNKKNH